MQKNEKPGQIKTDAVEDLVPLLVHKTGSGFYCSPSGKEYPTYKDAADDCVCWLNADVCMIWRA